MLCGVASRMSLAVDGINFMTQIGSINNFLLSQGSPPSNSWTQAKKSAPRSFLPPSPRELLLVLFLSASETSMHQMPSHFLSNEMLSSQREFHLRFKLTHDDIEHLFHRF